MQTKAEIHRSGFKGLCQYSKERKSLKTKAILSLLIRTHIWPKVNFFCPEHLVCRRVGEGKRGGSCHFPNLALLPGVVTPLKEPETSLCCQLNPRGTDTQSKVQLSRLHHYVLSTHGSTDTLQNLKYPQQEKKKDISRSSIFKPFLLLLHVHFLCLKS